MLYGLVLVARESLQGVSSCNSLVAALLLLFSSATRGQVGAGGDNGIGSSSFYVTALMAGIRAVSPISSVRTGVILRRWGESWFHKRDRLLKRGR